MCTTDNRNNRQSEARAPLRAIPAQTTPEALTAPIVQIDGSNAQMEQWPSPTKGPANRVAAVASNESCAPVESFELEDNTTGSGGTSWTISAL